MRFFLNQAWKELISQRRFAFLFLFNLALGLSGLITMEAFRVSLSDSLSQNAASILSADLSLSSRRPLDSEEEKLKANIDAGARSNSIETFSMIRTDNGSRLVLLKGVESNYPLRGSMELDSIPTPTQEVGKQLDRGMALVDIDLARQLKLKKGSHVRVGSLDLQVKGLITFDPTQSFRNLRVAGRIYLNLADLLDSGLIRKESTASYITYFAFENLDGLQERVEAWKLMFTDQAIRLSTAKDAAESSNRALLYLGDFLGLSALVALFLSSLGSAYLFRTWLVKRLRVMAVHQVLGLGFLASVAIPAIQLILLAVASVPLSLLFAKAELVALQWLITSLASMDIPATITLEPIALAFLIASAGSLLLALPFLDSLRKLEPKDLLHGKIPEPRIFGRPILFFIPALALFYFLAVYEARSFKIAGLFIGGLSGALILLLLVGLLLLVILRPIANRARLTFWPLRQALLYLSRRGITSVSAFLALALAALLLNLLPQLRAGLNTELESPAAGGLPTFFLFDIQDSQLAPLKEKVNTLGFTLENLSPLVRARLLSVNGEEFEKKSGQEGFQTREEETEARFRNRGFNLSFRQELNSSEKIIKGTSFSTDPLSTTVPEISLEERFADRLGLKIGDTLNFDIQGVEISGKVVNLRKVKWTSFRPNFFVIFQEGVLEEAPKTYLASISGISNADKNRVQDELTNAFPNVSIIDVRMIVDRALELGDRMRWCLNLMSAISLFAGLMVLFAIAARQAELRRWDINLCRILGAEPSEIRSQQLLEFGILSFLGSSFGALVSVSFAWILTLYIFDGSFSLAPLPLFLSILGTTALSISVAYFGAKRSWSGNAADILREESL